MNRILFVTFVAALAIVPLTAQAPTGWKLRADNSTNASDPDAKGDITFVASGSGFHATNPRAAVFWRPQNTIGGSYSLKGTFTLLEPSNHTNYYGLVFGGSDLGGPAQQYVYFLVAQDGTWLVKRRDGDARTDSILPKTASSAVRRPDVSGRSVNALEVRVTPAAIDFIVNDTVVSRWSGAAPIAKTDGTYGIRVNHFLNVQIDGLTAAPLAQAADRAALARDASQRAETVAVTGTVARVVSPTAFTVKDGDRAGAQDRLVVAPTLQSPVDANIPVTVFGTVAPTPLSDGPSTASMPIRATTVLSAAMVDLTKPLPPPITADEERLDGLMKRIAPAFASLRQAVDGANAAAAKQHAETLDQAFAEVEAFWTGKSRADAIAWAKTAHANAGAIAREAPAANFDSMKSATTTLGQQCQTCHGTYRQQFANGEFRIKISR
jgi:cytochrome c556